MRTYLILKDKAARWNADCQIREILEELAATNGGLPMPERYSKSSAAALLAYPFDKDAILKKRLPYERLDQLTVELLLGAR